MNELSYEKVTVEELRAGDKILSPLTHREVRVKRVEQPVYGLFRVYISDRAFDCYSDRRFTRTHRAEPDPVEAPRPYIVEPPFNRAELDEHSDLL